MLARLFTRPREERAIQVTPWGEWGRSSQSVTGVTVDATSSIQLLTVYGCVALITDTIATLPVHVYRKSAAGDPVEVSAPPWVDQPNPRTDLIEFISQVMTSLLLAGNAYIAYGIDRSFVTNQLVALPPDKVQVRVDDDQNPVYYVNGERFTGPLKHVKAITKAGELEGFSPLEAARQSIGLGLAAQEFAGRFYANGAHLSGVIEMEGELSPEAAKAMKADWQRMHSGLANAHYPGVLTGGAHWQPLSVTPEQAQFLDTRKWQAAEIAAQLFLVDPTLLGIPVDTNSLTYANLEQRGIHLVQFTLLRWLIRLERLFSSLLPKPQYLKFAVAGLERADLKTRYEAYRIGLGATQPFLLFDEVRRWEELPKVDPSRLAPPEPPAPPTPTATDAPPNGSNTND